MSLLTMIQDVCSDLGINEPSSVVGSTDKQIKQLLTIANREGKDLASRFTWNVLVKEATFTQSAAALQGAMTTVAGSDFDKIINDTMWNRSTTLPILGPSMAKDWQALQAFNITGPVPEFRIRGNSLYFSPDGANATDTIAFEYKSKNWCESSGGTGQSSWQADDDVGLLDEDIMCLGIVWRWLKRKGLDYAEDFATYEKRVADKIGGDGGKRVLNAAGSLRDRRPGVLVPAGSWNL